MRRCRWKKIDGNWIRVREDEGIWFINGVFCGVTRVYWDNIYRLGEKSMQWEYEQQLTMPEDEVFV